MSDARSLAYAINKFLKSEISEGKLPEEKVEGVEICIQCLEAAYEIGSSEPTLDVAFALQDIFQKYVLENEPVREPTDEEKAAADELKNEGNGHMDSSRFEDAIASYTKAIELDPTNPKYYCNRAAALNNLGNYEDAIRDSEMALRYDPYYGKAFWRLGTSHTKLGQNWVEAVRCFKRAVELEPDNERYKECLAAAEIMKEVADMLGRMDLSLNNSQMNDLDLLLRGQAGELGELRIALVSQLRNADFRSASPQREQPNSIEPPS